MSPFVNVLNNRASAPVWARDRALVLRAHAAVELAALLRAVPPKT